MNLDQSTDQAFLWIRRIVELGCEATDKDQEAEFSAAIAHAFALSLVAVSPDTAERLMQSIPVLVKMLRETMGDEETLQ